MWGGITITVSLEAHKGSRNALEGGYSTSPDHSAAVAVDDLLRYFYTYVPYPSLDPRVDPSLSPGIDTEGCSSPLPQPASPTRELGGRLDKNSATLGQGLYRV